MHHGAERPFQLYSILWKSSFNDVLDELSNTKIWESKICWRLVRFRLPSPTGKPSSCLSEPIPSSGGNRINKPPIHPDSNFHQCASSNGRPQSGKWLHQLLFQKVSPRNSFVRFGSEISRRRLRIPFSAFLRFSEIITPSKWKEKPEKRSNLWQINYNCTIIPDADILRRLTEQ